MSQTVSSLPVELLEALGRVGHGLNARASWLVDDFSNVAIEQASDADVTRLLWEALAWTVGDPRDARDGRAWVAITSSPFNAEAPPELLRKSLLELQGRLHGALNALLDRPDQRCVNLYPQAAIGVQRNPNGTLSRVLIGSMEVAFFSAVADLLAELWPRLRRCDPELDPDGKPYCGRYVAMVEKHRYCSPQHAARVRMRKYVAKPKFDASLSADIPTALAVKPAP
jgi:hypothetical protein